MFDLYNTSSRAPEPPKQLSSSSPIDLIPHEILREILIEVWSSLPTGPHNDVGDKFPLDPTYHLVQKNIGTLQTNQYTFPRYICLLVSKRWRSITLSTAILWSSLCLCNQGGDDYLGRDWPARLRLSGSASLNIEIWLRGRLIRRDKRYWKEIAEPLRRHRHRIWKLLVKIDDESSLLRKILKLVFDEVDVEAGTVIENIALAQDPSDGHSSPTYQTPKLREALMTGSTSALAVPPLHWYRISTPFLTSLTTHTVPTLLAGGNIHNLSIAHSHWREDTFQRFTALLSQSEKSLHALTLNRITFGVTGPSAWMQAIPPSSRVSLTALTVLRLSRFDDLGHIAFLLARAFRAPNLHDLILEDINIRWETNDQGYYNEIVRNVVFPSVKRVAFRCTRRGPGPSLPHILHCTPTISTLALQGCPLLQTRSIGSTFAMGYASFINQPRTLSLPHLKTINIQRETLGQWTVNIISSPIFNIQNVNLFQKDDLVRRITAAADDGHYLASSISLGHGHGACLDWIISHASNFKPVTNGLRKAIQNRLVDDAGLVVHIWDDRNEEDALKESEGVEEDLGVNSIPHIPGRYIWVGDP